MADRTFLAWPFFDEAHRALASSLDDWATRNLSQPDPEGADVDAAAKALVAALGRDGWLRWCVPAAYGGATERLDARSLCLARDLIARHSGLADTMFAMQGLGSAAIALFASEPVKQRYLPEVASGRRIAAFALSEPQAGSDVAAIATTARREGDSYVLDGTKTWISNAGIAHQYVLFARTNGAGTRPLSAFVVDAETPGLKVTERIQVSAPHPLGTLVLEGCRVSQDHLLGEPGDGFKVAMATLDLFRPTVGAAALGMARRALDEALARSRSRVAFGQPIAQFQMVQATLAEMAVEVDASALLVYRAAWSRDRVPGRVTREAAMAKLYATETAQRVVDAAVQLFGAAGVVAGSPVERLYREVRALRIYEGTSEIQKLVIARHVLAAAG